MSGISLSEYKGRLVHVQEKLQAHQFDALVVRKEANVKYLVGSDTGILVITPRRIRYWTKELYARLQRAWPVEPEIVQEGCVSHFLKAVGSKRIAVEDTSVSRFESLRKELRTVQLGRCQTVVSNIVERMRAVKSQSEIVLMRRSCAVAQEGMRKAYQVCRNGISEKVATATVEAFLRKQGSEKAPFLEGMIFASGSNGAIIHAVPTARAIRQRDVVVVDLGAVVSGYHSDITRTITVGSVSRNIKKVVQFVSDLQRQCVERVVPGVSALSIYEFARGKIEQRGYSFYHSLGHGVGLEIHELPNLGPGSPDILQEGMVVTIEPGIYIPNRFGVRFEDTVLVSKEPQVLTCKKSYHQ